MITINDFNFLYLRLNIVISQDFMDKIEVCEFVRLYNYKI